MSGVYDITAGLDPHLFDRLMATSHAIGVAEWMREIADDVAGWDADRVPPPEINRRILEWLDEQGVGYEAWAREPEVEALVRMFPQLDLSRLWSAFGFEAWALECVHSVALTDDPVPFLPFSAGFFFAHLEHEPPLLIAIMTPFTFPDTAGRQVTKKLKAMFGNGATRKRKDEVEIARVLRMHHQGMSHRDIAIQLLRPLHPDIIDCEHKYRAEIKREKARIAKVIPSAKKLWKERLGDSSTPEKTS